jgi:hypothetical protein
LLLHDLQFAAYRDFGGLRIKQYYEPIRILRAQRMMKAASNSEPILIGLLLFHGLTPHPQSRDNTILCGQTKNRHNFGAPQRVCETAHKKWPRQEAGLKFWFPTSAWSLPRQLTNSI